MSMIALSLARSILFKKAVIREINKQRSERAKREHEAKLDKQQKSIRKVRIARMVRKYV